MDRIPGHGHWAKAINDSVISSGPGGIYYCKLIHSPLRRHNKYASDGLDCAVDNFFLLARPDVDTFTNFKNRICNVLFNESFLIKAKYVHSRYGILPIQ